MKQAVLVDRAKMDELCQISDELSDPDKEMSVIEELFAVCHEEARKSIDLLANLAEQGNAEAAAAEAHKLRGLCLELGLSAMAELADAIECHAPAEEERLPEMIRQLEARYAETSARLADIFKGFAEPQ
jgi:HPt (histidine-containing phosphotransfer) domain-containing protein